MDKTDGGLRHKDYIQQDEHDIYHALCRYGSAVYICCPLEGGQYQHKHYDIDDIRRTVLLVKEKDNGQKEEHETVVAGLSRGQYQGQ